MSRSLTVASLACLVLGACLLWTVLAGPMLRNAKFGHLQSDRRLVIWNPFRNKEPERFGVQCLTPSSLHNVGRLSRSSMFPIRKSERPAKRRNADLSLFRAQWLSVAT